MKVVQINAVTDFGSTGRIVAELSDYMTECGIENQIVSTTESNRSNAYVIGDKIDHKLHALLSRASGMQGYFSRRATKKLVRWLDTYVPDVVHLHNLHGNFINFPILFDYLSKKNIAVVVTLHDCFFYTGKCVYYTIANCTKWQTGCGHCPQLQSGNPSWFLDRTTKTLRDKELWFSSLHKLGVIGVSDWITSEARQSILHSADQMKTLYNWIDLNLFSPHCSEIKEELGIAGKFLVLGVAITWCNDKGLEDYNELAKLLDDRFAIVLVGEKGGDMDERIIHIGRTENAQILSDLYSAADVFYNPTRRETFGKVTAEALACGTPVVAYRTTACTELVPVDCGMLETVGDVAAAAKDIEYVAERKAQYTESCRSFAEHNFDKDLILEKTVEFYKNLLS